MKYGIFVSASLLALAACSSGSAPAPSSSGAPLPAGLRSLGSPALRAARARWDGATALSQATAPPTAALPDVNAQSYPAFPPDSPRILDAGGKALASPKLVTVTWDGDSSRPIYEAMGAGLGASDYWKTARQWGVGPIADRGHVRISAPIDLTVEGAGDFVQANAAPGAGSGWSSYTPGTVYALYIPANSKGFTLGGVQYCGWQGFGYHAATSGTSADGGSAPQIPYVVACGISQPAYSTGIASAGIISAVTNPSPLAAPAYSRFDAAHLAWDAYEGLQSEVGSACLNFDSALSIPPPPFDFAVNGFWSNTAAAAGTNPCAPRTSSGVYYNTTTFEGELDDVTLDFSATGTLGSVTTKGIKVPIGSSKTFTIGFYSDGPSGDWTVSALVVDTLPVLDADGNPIPNGAVDVTIDHPAGHNGHRARVTVTPRASSSVFGGEYIELRSGNAEYTEPHTLPIFIGQ